MDYFTNPWLWSNARSVKIIANNAIHGQKAKTAPYMAIKGIKRNKGFYYNLAVPWTLNFGDVESQVVFQTNALRVTEN